MGEAEGKPRISNDDYFMGITHLVKERSTCVRAKVGAIVVKDKRIVTTGYNGAPKGLQHCSDVGCKIVKMDKTGKGEDLLSLEDHCTRTVHAEQNAIIQAGLFGVSIDGATLYCTHSPCYICAKMIINAGIKEIVYDKYYPDKLTEDVFAECDIKTREVKLK